MRFSDTFIRSMPGGAPPLNPALGSDATPTLVTDVSLTNGAYLRFAFDQTEISHSIAVVVAAPAGSDPIPVDLYFWDELTTRWYLSDTQAVIPGEVARLECSMLQPQPVDPGLPQPSHDLATGAYVLVAGQTVGGVYPVGDYVFAWGMDAQDPMQAVNTAIALLIAAIHNSDDPFVAGDAGFLALAVRNDGASTVLTSNNGDYSPVAVNDRGEVFVRISSGQDKTATGTIPAAGGGLGAVEIDTQQSGACAIKIFSTAWTGTINFEAQVSGSGVWDPIVGVVQGTGVGVTSTTANGLWVADCAAFSKVRAKGSAVATGVATVFLEAAIPQQDEVAQGPAGTDPWLVTPAPGATFSVWSVLKGTSVALGITGENIGPDRNALDTYDNAPTQAIYNYATSRGDGTAVYLGPTTITFATTPPIATPTSSRICRVRVFIDAATKPRVYEQGRNATLSIGGGIITVKAWDGTVAPLAVGNLIEVMWAGPDKDVVFEDAPAVSGEFIGKVGRVRRDVAISSAGSDGYWATGIQDADGYDYVRSKSYDSASNADRSFETAPVWSRNVATPVTIAAAQAVSAAWADLGPEIPTQGYTKIGLWLNITINDSQNVRVRMLNKHTSAHANEYTSVINSVDTSGPPFNVKFQAEYLEYDVDATGLVVLPFDVFNFVPFVQFRIMAEVAGATPAQITNAEVTYGYGG